MRNLRRLRLRKPTRKTAARVLLGLMVGGGGIGAIVTQIGTQAGGGGGGVTGTAVSQANVWVAANGSDVGASCVRSAGKVVNPDASGTGLCKSLQKACNLAQPGDTVGVVSGKGTFPAQPVTGCTGGTAGNTVFYGCDVAPTRDSKGAVTAACKIAAGAVTNGGLVLAATCGASSCSGSGVPPSYVTFDGLDIDGYAALLSGGGAQPSHVTLEYSHVHHYNEPTSGAGASEALVHASGNSGIDFLTIQKDEIGPWCCNGDGIQALCTAGVCFGHIVIDQNYIHDGQDSCSAVAGNGSKWPNTDTVNCTGSGFGDTGGSCFVPIDQHCDHVDAMQIFGDSGSLTITNNELYQAGNQGVFVQPANAGTVVNVLVAGNAVAETGTSATCGICLSGPGASTYSGYAKVLYNTVTPLGVQVYDSVSTQRILTAGTELDIVGNIVGNNGFHDSSGTGCTWTAGDGSTITPTFTKNMTPAANCAGNISGTATYVAASAAGNGGLPANLQLLGVQTASDAGDATWCALASPDFFGTGRPDSDNASACTLGAFEND